MFYEFKIDLNAFLKNYGFYLALGIVLIIVFVIAAILIFNKVNKRKTHKQVSTSYAPWIEALGGKNNIITANGNRSRLVISLKEISKINRESLDKLGVRSIITMNNKVTLVIDYDASLIANEINQNLLY